MQRSRQVSRLTPSFMFLVASTLGCGESARQQELPVDEHSLAQPNKVRVEHVALDVSLDFAKRQIVGKVTLRFARRDQTAPLILDTFDLKIAKVVGADGKERRFTLGARDELLGQAMSIELADGDTEVTVHYATTPAAKALQWLEKEQTYGGKHPYLYTQGEAIMTRSWIPLQDSPGVRVTYSARVEAPAELRVVMSAATRLEAGEADGKRVFTFEMDKPIPSYLIALACGDIGFQKISERCGVFADPALLADAASEFADTEKMLTQCEKLFGPYRWGRYDILVMPPAFPLGGMENPTLTFATPTIITGDKSLVALIAHELAHSWSGNLVTNATWRDFWLNEGFTVYLEQRIMELVYGHERYLMEVAIGVQGLRKELGEFQKNGNTNDQILYLDLSGRDPDDAMTAVPYNKGAAFLRRLEQVFGRVVFDEFLQRYFEEHAFQSITTAAFLAYLDAHLLQKQPAKAKQVDVQTWVYKPGLPATMPEVQPKGFAEVDQFRQAILAGQVPEDAKPGEWITHQWLHFIHGLPAEIDDEKLRQLDQSFGFASSPNPEVRSAFLAIALKRQSLLDLGDHFRDFARQIGRRKFLEPIFRSLVCTDDGRGLANDIFVEIAPRLHFMTRQTLQEIIER